MNSNEIGTYLYFNKSIERSIHYNITFRTETISINLICDKYKMKQDLERRLQTVQDSAEKKGLISNEEINIERGGIE